MIDFSNLEHYRENNRIEAKRSLGGLPLSMWETYSAFANTLGGIILLGVEEYRDKSLHAIDLPEPERLVSEFWALVNNPARASVNILAKEHVEIQNVDGSRIIVITVPRAQRFDKPVYIDGNPLSGSYRRNGEGDYRCTREEVESMLRDAAVQTLDMRLLTDMGSEIFDRDSVRRYRAQVRSLRPGYAGEALDDRDFLCQLGAAGRDENGLMHPTAAGLLMFGRLAWIIREFPDFRLDYQERMDASGGLTYRLDSASGNWSGNLYDFYFQVSARMVGNIGGAVHDALREALANSLINADYYGKRGLSVVKRMDMITISNPGVFRIGLDTAKSGGISDPRNEALFRLFNIIRVGNHTGSGIPNIYSVWRRQGWTAPMIAESFEPERITLTLKMCNGGGTTTASGDREFVTEAPIRKAAVVDYLTDNISAKSSEIAELLGVNEARAKQLLKQMESDDIIIAGPGGTYRLKS